MTCTADNDESLEYEEQAAEWCWRISDCGLPYLEQAQFDTWIRADERHQQLFDTMAMAWKDADAIAEMPEFLTLRTQALTAMKTANARSGLSLSRRHRNLYIAFAAAALLVIFSGGFWSLASDRDVYETGIGEQQIVQLDDGSHMSLDASSRVTVFYSDAKRALVLERGRAKFEVENDPLRPFLVTAGKQVVVAKGTAFTVELLRKQMRVQLYEGSVSVLPEPSPKLGEKHLGSAVTEKTLLPGQELIADLSSGATAVVAVEIERSLAWESGVLNFVNEPLSSAVERVNRYTDVPIVIGDDEAGQHLVSGVFEAGDTHSFVKGVTSLFPLLVKKDSNEIKIISKKMQLM